MHCITFKQWSQFSPSRSSCVLNFFQLWLCLHYNGKVTRWKWDIWIVFAALSIKMVCIWHMYIIYVCVCHSNLCPMSMDLGMIIYMKTWTSAPSCNNSNVDEHHHVHEYMNFSVTMHMYFSTITYMSIFVLH